MDWKTSNVITYTNSLPCKSLQLLNYKKISVICVQYMNSIDIIKSRVIFL